MTPTEQRPSLTHRKPLAVAVCVNCGAILHTDGKWRSVNCSEERARPHIDGKLCPTCDHNIEAEACR